MKPNKIKSLTIRFAAFFCCVISFISLLPVTGHATELEDIPLNNAQSVYLYNIENDKVLVSQNEEKRLPPASTVKIMAGLIAVEHMASDLDKKVKVTQEMREGVIGNDYGLKAGDTPTYRDLLYLAFCGCYNDAVSIIEHVVAGSPAAFVNMMNTKAANLGMANTHYTNATGMHDTLMYTTVNDIVKLSLEAYRSSLFMMVTSAAKYTTEGLAKESSFYNRNYLVGKGRMATYYNSLCRGLNAGSTSEGGYCVVTVAESDGLSYLCIVMGATADADGKIYSYSIANLLIKWAYEKYGYIELLSAQDLSYEIKVTLSMDTETVLVVPQKTIKIYQKIDIAGNAERIRYQPNFTVNSLAAPVVEGTPVGEITVYVDDKPVATVPLVTKTSVARGEMLYVFECIREFSRSRFFIASLVSSVIITIGYLIIKSSVRASRANKRSKYR